MAKTKVTTYHYTGAEVSIEGTKATIEIDLSKSYGESKSGKSITVATTAGCKEIGPAKGKQGALLLNLNIFRKKTS